MIRSFFFAILFLNFSLPAIAKVELGVDLFFKEGHARSLKGKRVGLVTNQTGVNGRLETTVDIFKGHAGAEFILAALFTPEHGLEGIAYADEKVASTKDAEGLPIHSLHGATKRPTSKMLKGIDVLVFDIQDIGVRSYTYASTLFYLMEEASSKKIEVIVLDRPNPMTGVVVDGPMLKEKFRSFIGYVNVPFCHGMTMGELATFFNKEYAIGCRLKIIPMKGWERGMSFDETGLSWIPTSPYIPEGDTPYFYGTTGLLGALSLVNIGIGFTLPFKLVGAPWINGKKFAEVLNKQKIPGVVFFPFYFRPMYGLYKGENCQGVKIVITNKKTYRPMATQCLILGILKTLYPKTVQLKLNTLPAAKKRSFCLAAGNEDLFNILQKEPYPAWKMIHFQEAERKAFLETRAKYLLY